MNLSRRAFFKNQRFGFVDIRDSYVGQQYGVYLQRFAADGTPDGAEELVNQDHVTGDQRGAQLIGLADGGYIVTWHSTNWVSAENSGQMLFLQQYAADGARVGDNHHLETEFDLTINGSLYPNTVPYNLDAGVEVAPGTLGFVWSDSFYPQSVLWLSDLQGQRQSLIFLPDGDFPSFAQLADGSLAVAWQESDFGLTSSQVFGAVYDSTGGLLVDRFAISAAGGEREYQSQVTALPDGNFVVSWFSFEVRAVEARVMAPDGTPVSDIVQLTPEGADVSDWDIAATSTGIRITWESGTTDQYVFSATFMARDFVIDTDGALTELGDGGVTQSFGPAAAFVMGGLGDDALTGSAAADMLAGGDGNDTLLGGDGADKLNGDNGDDSLRGEGGRDVLDGGAGRDILLGGDDDDALFGGLDNDTLTGQDGNDFLVAGYHVYGNLAANESDRLAGGAGNDTLVSFFGGSLDGGLGDDLIFGPGAVTGGDGNDTIVGTTIADGGPGEDVLIVETYGIDLINGGSFWYPETSATDPGSLTGFEVIYMIPSELLRSQRYIGDDGDNTLVFFDAYIDAWGNGGDDLLISGNTVGPSREAVLSIVGVVYDTEIHGGAGDDTILGGLNDNAFNGDGGHDLLEGFSYRDTLRGGQGNDTLIGHGELDRLFGGAGDDVLDGGADADHLDGGPSSDLVIGGLDDDTLIGGAGDDEIDGGFGLDTALFAGNAGDAVITQISGGLEVVTSDGRDVVFGVELLQFDDGTVLASDYASGTTVSGTPGDNLLVGDGGGDTLTAAGGNDTAFGALGDDDIAGGIGFDVLIGDTGNDTLRGANGYDTLWGDEGNDLLLGNFGLDLLYGGRDADTLLGGLGPDTLHGEDGGDLLQGNQGADSLEGGAGDDTPEGNAGADTLDGGFGNDLLTGGINNDELRGSWGDDTLDGGAGADVLLGQTGNNILNGNSGSDRLVSGNGDDTMSGGMGADVFVFPRDFGHKADVITDFQPGIDSIEVSERLIDYIGLDPDDPAGSLERFFVTTADGDLRLNFGTSLESVTFLGITDPMDIIDALIFV